MIAVVPRAGDIVEVVDHPRLGGKECTFFTLAANGFAIVHCQAFAPLVGQTVRFDDLKVLRRPVRIGDRLTKLPECRAVGAVCGERGSNTFVVGELPQREVDSGEWHLHELYMQSGHHMRHADGTAIDFPEDELARLSKLACAGSVKLPSQRPTLAPCHRCGAPCEGERAFCSKHCPDVWNFIMALEVVGKLAAKQEKVARAFFETDELVARHVDEVSDALIEDGDGQEHVDQDRIQRAMNIAWDRDVFGKRTEWLARTLRAMRLLAEPSATPARARESWAGEFESRHGFPFVSKDEALRAHARAREAPFDGVVDGPVKKSLTAWWRGRERLGDFDGKNDLFT